VSGLHPAASLGFARSAAAYERGRPDYPRAAIEFLAARLGLGPGTRVVDLAAGTGKLTRSLLATDSEVVAVEPVAEMRAALPGEARALEGTAEAIPLPAGSAEAVAVGQAFHWFDGDAALAEIHRVLRPGGALALVWNRQRMDDRLNQAIEELIAPHRGDAATHRSEAWRAAFERTALLVRSRSASSRTRRSSTLTGWATGSGRSASSPRSAGPRGSACSGRSGRSRATGR
jgi:ubiquinone/menaquinone biosynthesis C-methylase UbiE